MEETLELTARQRVLLCVNAALEKKPKNLVILNIKEVSSFADYYILMREGTSHGKWILLDYIDVVISIFYEPIRAFYDLERLWSDAPSMEIPDDTKELTALSDGM